MMSRKPSRLLALVLLTALCSFLLAPGALAFERVDLTQPLSFAIQADDNEDDAHLPGVTFQLYQVADMDEDARFTLRSPYSNLTIDINAMKNETRSVPRFRRAGHHRRLGVQLPVLPDLCADPRRGGRMAVQRPFYHQAGAFARAD